MHSFSGYRTAEWHGTQCKRYRKHSRHTVRFDASIELNDPRLDTSGKHSGYESSIAKYWTEPGDSLSGGIAKRGNAARRIIRHSQEESYLDLEKAQVFLGGTRSITGASTPPVSSRGENTSPGSGQK